MNGFESTDYKPVFLDKVECTGTEKHLNECITMASTGKCSSAGVTCKNSLLTGSAASHLVFFNKCNGAL